MSGIKKLAGQTLWYGVPTIVSRFLNYLLTLLLVGIFQPGSFGVITQVYTIFPFLNILFTYGLETSYFRFSQTHDQKKLYNTLTISLLFTSIVLTLALFLVRAPLERLIELDGHTEYIAWIAWITFFDTLAVLPFSKLRQEGRPKKFAFVRVVNIVVNIVMVLFFYYGCPPLAKAFPGMFGWYQPGDVVYVIIANFIASALTFVQLLKEFTGFTWKFSVTLWKQVMKYSYPLIIVGLGGQINEMLSRLVYVKVSPDNETITRHDLGVFGANYKLAVLITIFIQVFRMAAEPFFFNKSKDQDARRTYARIMKFFVIACCGMFLVIALFMDIWRLLITWKYPQYGEGIHIVPILALGGVFLGIYYNLSVWYKLTDRNMTGAWITLAGAVITIALNFWWVPYFRYTGSAWATFVCYGFMMVVSYRLGQKHYRIPYAWKKLLAYLVISVLVFLFHELLVKFYGATWFSLITGLLLLGGFILFVLKIEKKEFAVMPFIGKYVARL